MAMATSKPPAPMASIPIDPAAGVGLSEPSIVFPGFIHLSPKTLSIYDCIEFNDRFRYIDVASDVAFLAMDFDHYERPDLSCEIAARMAAALRDSEMLRLMDFYKCYRAYVRGKVESFHQAKAEVPEAEQRNCRMQAERYF